MRMNKYLGEERHHDRDSLMEGGGSRARVWVEK